ncbi:disease resistance protein RPV1 [Lactuca sativa]|uniref:disease resistance protein RPV1 n=1 Tax=Lactuca sativa TaxID=4236 RepID=UPI000CCB17B2|nr:disease resistance protein RPV1 [Lactuca sativa]XP_052623543.1 disease resistance protein RPV1 [Lactuca sativa]
MASSSTSFIHKSFKYDVFLSFRGKDTRRNFVDHLYSALQQKSIHTYKDDERIKRGKMISNELIGSIEDSKFYIIVFSKNYASSSWCLDELVKIMECHKTTEHTAYPVFYDVEPTEVRNQSLAVGEAFAKHEKEEAAGKWREALKEAADLAGWELKNTAHGHEAKFIKQIVEELSLELRSINFSIDEKLVGMETRIKDVISSLGIGFDDVRMIGIKGMGGSGKTTLARVVFDHISCQFEGKSFVENVREVSNASLSGLKVLQNQILLDVLNDQNIKASSVHEGKNMMKRMMPGRKVLIVLDDVDHIDQLEALAGEPNWFKRGSRIVITTRDEQVLLAHRVNLIRDVNLLLREEAFCLFSRYAFGREIPIQGYEWLSEQVVRYACGLPLTIRVLGSFLCAKNKLEWIDALERLKTIPLKETLKKLELSYIDLEDDYKEIFLDVACILKGWPKYLAIEALESCGYHARNGLRVLEQKSLLTISHDKPDHKYVGIDDHIEYVGMHDHMEEMGKNIVRRLHLDKPQKHSRLWIEDEIEDVLVNELGTKATRCVRFYTKKLNPEIIMKGLQKMKELRFLAMSPNSFDSSYCSRFRWNWDFDKVSPYFPNVLRYLRWNHYPFTSLPKTFQVNNLVALGMAYSDIVQLWEGDERKVLNKLRFLDLSYSMLRTLDLGLTPNLEALTLVQCYNLVELHMPVECLKLKSVELSGSKFRTLDLGLAPKLELLDLENCRNLVKLHMPSRCLNLRSLKLTTSRLKTLDIGPTPNLEYLNLKGCYYLEKIQMPNECQKLTSLNISHSKLRTLNIGLTPNLEYLDLKGCHYLENLLMTNKCQKLASLNITHSKLRTLDLGLTPNVKNLDLKECCNLVELQAPMGCLKKLVSLHLSDRSRFRSFSFQIDDDTSCSVDELLKVGPLAELHLTAKSIERCPFHPENIMPKFQFTYFYKDVPLLTRNLEKLISVGLCACTNLETFSGSICGLQHLRMLKLQGNIPQVPKDLDQLECLEELSFSYTKIKHLPDNICMLKHLKSLELISCRRLGKLPDDLGLLECLEKLTLSFTKIKYLPDSICMLKFLASLKLTDSSLLEKLPEDLGQLECLEKLILRDCKFLQEIPSSICKMTSLKELDIEGTCISRLPQSIVLLKGLHIIGCRGLLESCGFTSKIRTSANKRFCFIDM